METRRALSVLGIRSTDWHPCCTTGWLLQPPDTNEYTEHTYITPEMRNSHSGSPSPRLRTAFTYTEWELVVSRLLFPGNSAPFTNYPLRAGTKATGCIAALPPRPPTEYRIVVSGYPRGCWSPVPCHPNESRHAPARGKSGRQEWRRCRLIFSHRINPAGLSPSFISPVREAGRSSEQPIYSPELPAPRAKKKKTEIYSQVISTSPTLRNSPSDGAPRELGTIRPITERRLHLNN